jgi:hypothetical protein
MVVATSSPNRFLGVLSALGGQILLNLAGLSNNKE